MKIYKNIPEGYGECPVCNGTGLGRELSSAESTWFSGRSHAQCMNCGGQTMINYATGLVKLNSQNEPCTHEYKTVKRGNCYYVYTCIHCNFTYDVDSSD